MEYTIYTVDTELELELVQTQMTQKPMLRAELYARAIPYPYPQFQVLFVRSWFV